MVWNLILSSSCGFCNFTTHSDSVFLVCLFIYRYTIHFAGSFRTDANFCQSCRSNESSNVSSWSRHESSDALLRTTSFWTYSSSGTSTLQSSFVYRAFYLSCNLVLIDAKSLGRFKLIFECCSVSCSLLHLAISHKSLDLVEPSFQTTSGTRMFHWDKDNKDSALEVDVVGHRSSNSNSYSSRFRVFLFSIILISTWDWNEGVMLIFFMWFFYWDILGIFCCSVATLTL